MDRRADRTHNPIKDQKKEMILNHLKGIDSSGAPREWQIPDSPTADQVLAIYQAMEAEREAYWRKQFTDRGYIYPEKYELKPDEKKNDLLNPSPQLNYELKPTQKYNTHETITPYQPEDSSATNGDYIRDLIQELQAESDARDDEFQRELDKLTHDTKKNKLLLNLPDRT